MYPLLKKYFNTIKGFIPAKAESTSVGVDIGTGECKLVEIKKSGDGFELLNWAVEPVIGGNVKSAIQKSFEQLAAVPTKIYTSVFGKGTLIRYIDMPRMSLDDLKGSFGIEADKYFPFTQDQIYTDCYILDGEGKGKQMSVMAAAAKRELIDERLKLLTDLNVQTEFIGVDPIALANVLNVLGFGQDGKKEKNVALLDMGDLVSNLTILVNGQPRFTRDIFIGGRDFTKRIGNARGISMEDAEKLKSNSGEKEKEIIDICESPLSNIVQELRLSFDYFSTEKNNEINELLLTGGGSLLSGLIAAFEEQLEINTNKWNPMTTLTLSSSIDKEKLNAASSKLGVALGLALYEYD